MSEGLRRLGIPTTFLTDVWCEPVLRRAGFEPRLIQEAIDSLPAGTTHLVAIERLGRTRGGRYFNMRGVDVTATTGDVDRWFSQDRDGGRRTIGIGDGGNEIGMGNVEERVRQHIPNGPTIASCVTTDWNIAAGTSNWGAWGLLAMLSLMTGRPLLPTREEAAKQLESLVAAGAVDGVTGIRAATVDKLEPEVYFHLLDALWKRHDGSKNGSGADSSPPPCDHGDRR